MLEDKLKYESESLKGFFKDYVLVPLTNIFYPHYEEKEHMNNYLSKLDYACKNAYKRF